MLLCVLLALGLYANVRPCVAYQPYVRTKHPGMNVVIIRENEEDLYCGIEYRQTDNVCVAFFILFIQFFLCFVLFYSFKICS
jgi:isocitrate dehydrogenase